jgi:hypothetical protein
MGREDMIIVAILVAAITAGGAAFVLALIRVGTGREGRNGTLTGNPPTRAAAAARRFTGLYVRAPEAHLGNAREYSNQ